VNLWDRVLEKYSRDGLVALLRSSRTFLINQLRFRVEGAFRTGWGNIRGDEILQDPDVLSIAQRSGRLWKYGEDERVSIEYDGDQQLHPELEQMLGTYHPKAPFVCETPGRTLVSSVPGVNTDGGFVLERESSIPYHRAFIDSVRTDPTRIRHIYSSKVHDKHVEEFEEAFLLSAYPPPSYYHWVLDYLPKMQAYEYYRRMTGKDPVIVVPRELPRWRVEALEHVGYGLNDCVRWQEGPEYADRLVVPFHRDRTPKPGSFTPSLNDCRWLRGRVFGNMERTDADFSSRVYLSRRDASSRRVANESEVERILNERGFESYALREMSFSEGVQLFEQAEAVIGPHGAGFVNLLFADDVDFLEFLPEDDIRGGYLCLSRQLGHSYRYQLCERGGDDIRVDISDLTRNVDRMRLSQGP